MSTGARSRLSAEIQQVNYSLLSRNSSIVTINLSITESTLAKNLRGKCHCLTSGEHILCSAVLGMGSSEGVARWVGTEEACLDLDKIPGFHWGIGAVRRTLWRCSKPSSVDDIAIHLRLVRRCTMNLSVKTPPRMANHAVDRCPPFCNKGYTANGDFGLNRKLIQSRLYL